MHHALLLPALLELLAKSALLLLGATAFIAAARRLSAAQQHVLWLAVFAALLLLPLTKSIAPRWRLPGSPTTPVVTVLTALPQTPIEAATVETTPAPAPKKLHLPDTSSLALWAWLTGTAGIVAYRLLGSLQIAWLRRGSAPSDNTRLAELAQRAATEMNLRTACAIRLAEAVRVPCTWGFWRPVVLLPAAAEHDWPAERLLAALRHEFAHVSRRDYLARWISLLTCAIYWPNPLVWLAARRLHIAQEQACDDLVLAAGTPPADYAALLVETARAAIGAPFGLRAAVAMARPSTLEGRVLAIVDETRRRHAAGRATTLAGALGAAAIIGASALAQVAPEKSAPAAFSLPDLKNQVIVRSHFLEVPKGLLDNLPATPFALSGVWTREQADEMWRMLQGRPGVDIVSAPAVTTLSGQPATIRNGREYELAPGSQPSKRFVGTTFEFLPAYEFKPGAEKQTIDLDLAVQRTTLKEDATIIAGKPVFDEQKTRFAVTIFDHCTVIVYLGPAQREGRELWLLVDAGTIVPGQAAAAPATEPASPPPQKAPTESAALKKAQEIILPKIEFRDASLKEAIDFLCAKAVALDPEIRGVNVVIKAGANADAHISLSLTNVPLIEALKYVASLANLEVRAEPHALILGVPPPAASGQPIVEVTAQSATFDQKANTAVFSGDASAKVQRPGQDPLVLEADNLRVVGITPAAVESAAHKKAATILIPKLELREASVTEAVDFLRTKAHELDPEKTGVNIILKATGTPAEARITLALTNMPLSEALRYVADLANLKLSTEPNAFVLEPKK